LFGDDNQSVSAESSSLPTFAVHLLPHNPPHLELHSPLCGDFNRLQRFGILCSSRRGLPHFKDTEVTKLQAAILGKLRGYLIEELLDDRLDSAVLALSPLCNSVHEFFFGYCCYQPTLKPDRCRLHGTVYARDCIETNRLWARLT